MPDMVAFDRLPLIVALVVYLILQFAIAFIASRTIKVEADYFVAGRKLGTYAVAMSVFATWFGAESVMGSSGAVAAEGLAGGRADPFGYTICLLAMATFIAFKMREAGVITFVDFFRQRFGVTANWLAALLTIPTSIIWASAQLLAMGQIVGEVTGLETNIGLLIGATVIIVYTTVGGLLGDVITDIVQGTILIVSLLILLLVVLVSHQFPLDLIRPEQLTMIALGDDGQPQSLLATLDAWMVPILGSLVAQEAISRFLGARTPSVARMGCYWAAGIYLVIGSVPVLLGLLGTAVGFEATDQDRFLPQLASQYLDPIMYVVLMGAIVSAILSTVDTTLLAVSAIATRNIVEPLVPNLTEVGKVRVGRALTASAGLIALAFAASGQGIKDLVEIASSFGSSGILVALMFGLHTKFGDERAAVAALATGGIISILGDGVIATVASWFIGADAAGELPAWTQGFEGGYVFSVLGALAAYLSVAFTTATKRPAEATAGS
ncbi:MAG: sodium:solute symporter family protein [Hyphomonadaceae bacterium]